MYPMTANAVQRLSLSGKPSDSDPREAARHGNGGRCVKTIAFRRQSVAVILLTGSLILMMNPTALGDDNKVYGRYEPRDSGYFHWTAPWPSDEWHCGYPVIEGAQVIELTDGKYGEFNGHNSTVLIDGHIFVGHNNHKHHRENSSGQRCLGWIYKLGDPWTRESFNKHQRHEPIDLFPLPAPMNKRKFEENARYFGNPQFHELEDGRIMVRASVVTIRRGTPEDPDGRVNTWVPICDLARTITPQGELGPVKLVRVRDKVALSKAQDEGYLKFPDASEEAWVDELFRREMGRPEYKRFATDGYKAAEFRDIVWIDKEAGHAVCMGRGENTYGIFRGYTTETRDGGETWAKPEPTNIPSGENTITLRRLPDGRLAILGTFADRFQGERRPLCIAISEDGRNFSQVYRLSNSKEKHQMVGVVFDEKYMYVAGPHRSNGNAGRGEHFILRLPLKELPPASNGTDLEEAE
mgnify:FL=1